jgi:hypothetical protein
VVSKAATGDSKVRRRTRRRMQGGEGGEGGGEGGRGWEGGKTLQQQQQITARQTCGELIGAAKHDLWHTVNAARASGKTVSPVTYGRPLQMTRNNSSLLVIAHRTEEKTHICSLNLNKKPKRVDQIDMIAP